MDNKEKIDFIKKSFLKIKENDQRLCNGFKLRKQMLQDLEEGKDPKGYRSEWLIKSSNRVIKLLTELAYDFNCQHSDDKASVLDMVDVLKNAITIMKKR